MSEVFSTTLTSATAGFRGADVALALDIERTLETVHWTYVAEAVAFFHRSSLQTCPGVPAGQMWALQPGHNIYCVYIVSYPDWFLGFPFSEDEESGRR